MRPQGLERTLRLGTAVTTPTPLRARPTKSHDAGTAGMNGRFRTSEKVRAETGKTPCSPQFGAQFGRLTRRATTTGRSKGADWSRIASEMAFVMLAVSPSRNTLPPSDTRPASAPR